MFYVSDQMNLDLIREMWEIWDTAAYSLTKANEWENAYINVT